MKRRRFWLRLIAAIALGAVGACVYFVRSNPLVFNESLWQHAHCMPQAASLFQTYARDHGGRFPYHTNGYGDALLEMTREPAWFYLLTGPGYDAAVFEEALTSGGNVDESRCGRVYVQGLSETNDTRIAIFFDKVAAPPDHCHFPKRLWRGYVREVCLLDGIWRTVPVEKWEGFVSQQIGLLDAAGFPKEQAQRLYAEAR